MTVRAKKHLGQHFLKDENIASDIVQSLTREGYSKVLEIGPGMGVLTKYLLADPRLETHVIEIDRDSIPWLKTHFPELKDRIVEGDFLQYPFQELFQEPFAIIGNFPYNISTEILFQVLEHRSQIPEVVGMFQKEVAERLAAPPGSKTYGITSVLIQAWYDIEYLFTVHEHVFQPPPKVKSAVIRLRRNKAQDLGCNEALFIRVVKMAFNQRRKTLRNALRGLIHNEEILSHPFFALRAERLSVKDFVELTGLLG
ncbi:MAG TPA: 16S rRNA (adenine(1518)-N(6)/adenine(1519)-N(6))-dimethyltransferase RsmA [Bacteroidia bacterium]|jgi:16S rRNA (adenine1518-N6/adenine1519-N6)-dimethyltransferase|nr:16S rRNA (adenine(1518)-N(6)/adenine(1519)-N(6))-dimethyltransferase RsmA [Bacteroidia bacterium]